MTRFVLIPGASGSAWLWHRVVPLLEDAGHEAIAVDLPGDDPDAGLQAYADLTVAACGSDPDLVVVAMSLGGFTAPLVAERVDVRQLVLLNAILPVPGGTAASGATPWARPRLGWRRRRRAATRQSSRWTRTSSTTCHPTWWPSRWRTIATRRSGASRIAATFTAWPASVRALGGVDDRLFPIDLQRRVACERLGVET